MSEKKILITVGGETYKVNGDATFPTATNFGHGGNPEPPRSGSEERQAIVRGLPILSRVVGELQQLRAMNPFVSRVLGKPWTPGDGGNGNVR